MSTRAKLIWSIGGILAVVLFFGVFIAGLPWRWQVERRMAEVRARGEPVCLADLKPKAVPAEEDGGPLLEAIWRDLGPLPAFQDHYRCSDFGAEKNQVLIRQAAAEFRSLKDGPTTGKSSSQIDLELVARDLVNLLLRQPQILDRFDQALRRPHFQFSMDYQGRYCHLPLTCYDQCRQSTDLLVKLSDFFQALGDRQKAQQCRVLLLRCPRPLDEGFHHRSSAYHLAIGYLACDCIERQLTGLSQTEILELKQAVESLHPWDNWVKCLLATRVKIFDSLTLRYSEVDKLYLGAKGDRTLHFYYGTSLHFIDGLNSLNEFNSLFDGKPLNLKNLFQMDLCDVSREQNAEAAVIRRFRIRLELELIQRRSGAYPADLKGIALPQDGIDGTPMIYGLGSDGKPLFWIGEMPLFFLRK